jgi:hypothetical protein
LPATKNQIDLLNFKKQMMSNQFQFIIINKPETETSTTHSLNNQALTLNSQPLLRVLAHILAKSKLKGKRDTRRHRNLKFSISFP